MESNDEQSQAKEELDEYCVTLRFFGDDLDPDQVSQLIGSAPTASARRGDIRQGKVRSYTAKTGSWRFSTAQTTKDIEEQFLALFDQFTADLSVWRSLTTRFQADVFCGVFFSRISGGLAFSPRLHRLLADRNLEVILDIYASDEPTENA